ncbi:hypothetical protein [Heyndrickxia camelliae]|uniref:Uncharacterized protein n=1 Tax=Heyndrickxia camelliae TaxID=1707093 RepID=A0A2N3LJT1_9BACI|nr:hypothetical protein [Heyndrickxia camelliae]PKR84799.1 hypothetical protein CWO92_12270 [Heyndrickxia camelliae]
MLSRILNQQVPTSAGAIVMATRILLLGALHKVVSHHKDLAILSTILVIFLLFILFMAFGRDMIHGLMWERHLRDPISSFEVGTWVAATSISILVMRNFAPFLKAVAFTQFLLNCLWTIGYIVIIIRNYAELFKSTGAILRGKVHGIFLLACVAIQSMIASGQSVLGRLFVNIYGTWLWWFEFFLYGLGLAFILNRYIRSKSHNLTEN